MRIIIHCGLDKAGSTAIQAHVGIYRDWLLNNGIYVPRSGLSGFGHVALFSDLGQDNWQPLLDELQGVARGAFSRCFLSYEGICFFDASRLQQIKRYLGDYPVTLLFYLREQAQIIQSGYLQTLKSERNPVSMAHIKRDYSLLEPQERDYFRLLQRFEDVFPEAEIALRPYQPGAWQDGSIIWDFLKFLGCPPGEEFTPAKNRQNPSLDFQSAEILNVFDTYTEDAGHRAALVEDLLWLNQRYPTGSKYFLDPGAVQHIRTFFARSNTALAERYGLEFDYAPCAAAPSPGPGADGTRQEPSYIQELARLAGYPRWAGDQLDGEQLASVLRHNTGWARPETWGTWSLGDASGITFRLPLLRYSGFENSLVLDFRGRYFAQNLSTGIWLNGQFLENTDLRQASLKIPFALLEEDRLVQLELRHAAPVSPAALSGDSDTRCLAYGLERMSYRLSAE